MLSDVDEAESQPAQVDVLALHAAKGAEFPGVILVGSSEGLLPHLKHLDGDDVEKERRLFFVGVTRSPVRPEALSEGIRRC